MKSVFKSLIFCGFYLCAPYGMAITGSGSGSDCGGDKTPNYDVESHRNNSHGATFTLLDYLNEHVEKVAIVGRAGDDISVWNYRNPAYQKYTHAGIVWKNPEDGQWWFKHVLNICRGETSRIFDQTVLEFFDDGPHFYDFHIGFPSLELQESISAVLEDEALFKSLHNTQYNMISNPSQGRDQNSNGWVLSVIAAAQSGLRNSGRIRQYYMRNGYLPSQVQVNWGGLISFFKKNATTKYHSKEGKRNGWYSFVSVASLFQYLHYSDTLIETEICHPKGCNEPFARLNKQEKQNRHSFDPLRDGR